VLHAGSIVEIFGIVRNLARFGNSDYIVKIAGMRNTFTPTIAERFVRLSGFELQV
jgi:hypothetical protein